MTIDEELAELKIKEKAYRVKIDLLVQEELLPILKRREQIRREANKKQV